MEHRVSEGSEGVAAVVMAAGESRRMGRPKALLPWRGTSLVRHATQVALDSSCSSVFVVLGAEYERVAAELRDLPIEIVLQPDWALGLSSSLRRGVEAVRRKTPHCEAALVMLADQPLVTPTLLDRLLLRRTTSGQPIVACSYSETRGPPAVFDRRLFDDLCRLTGDRGAKALLTEHPDEVATVDFPDGSVDIDTPADYRSALTD